MALGFTVGITATVCRLGSVRWERGTIQHVGLETLDLFSHSASRLQVLGGTGGDDG
ncbi:MAG: hypothetical protein NVS4B8_29960 [Herpetosiphon sp.]